MFSSRKGYIVQVILILGALVIAFGVIYYLQMTQGGRSLFSNNVEYLPVNPQIDLNNVDDQIVNNYRSNRNQSNQLSIISPKGKESIAEGDVQNIDWSGGKGPLDIILETYENGEIVTKGIIARSIDPTLKTYTWNVGEIYGATGTDKIRLPYALGKYFIRINDTVTGDVVRSNDLVTIEREYQGNIAGGVGKCGLLIQSPKNLSNIVLPVMVSGYIDNSRYKKEKCRWQMFEGQAGTARLYYDYNNQGWAELGEAIPIQVSNWMATTTPFLVGFYLHSSQIELPVGTPMKITFKEEDPSGANEPDKYDLLFSFAK